MKKIFVGLLVLNTLFACNNESKNEEVDEKSIEINVIQNESEFNLPENTIKTYVNAVNQKDVEKLISCFSNEIQKEMPADKIKEEFKNNQSISLIEMRFLELKDGVHRYFVKFQYNDVSKTVFESVYSLKEINKEWKIIHINKFYKQSTENIKNKKEVSKIENLNDYNWIGKYGNELDEYMLGYLITINYKKPKKSPKDAIYGFTLLATGRQLHYEIEGYITKTESGNILFYFTKLIDGVWNEGNIYDLIYSKKPVFTFEKVGNKFKVISTNEIWDASTLGTFVKEL